MLTLKEIPGVSATLGNTPISRSALWNTPVDRIVPAQLTAFRARMALENRAKNADAAIEFILGRVNESVCKGEIPYVNLLAYSAPRKRVLLSSDLVAGFERMQRPMPAAILFGLEMVMPADEVVTLTWQKVRHLRMTPFAWHCVKSQPIHISSPYVFWWQRGESVMPLFGLEQEVFDVFGMVWGELMAAYENLALQ